MVSVFGQIDERFDDIPPSDSTDDILRNFHTFGIFIPDLKKKENVLINTKHSKMLAAQDSQNRPKQNLEFYDEMEDKLTGGKLK